MMSYASHSQYRMPLPKENPNRILDLKSQALRGAR